MGMYTEFVFASELKKETPEEIINILKDMVNGNSYNTYSIPNHEFFKCDRWKCLFTGDSYYFDGGTMSKITYDDITKTYFLTVRSNLKNYDSEIERFLDFIYPYLDEKYDTSDFLGYYRYEENREPDLIYYSELNKGSV